MNTKERLDAIEARLDKLEQQLPTESLISCSPVEPEIAELTETEVERLKRAEPRWAFTEDEKTILKNVDEYYNWLVRDADDTLWVHGVCKPEKRGTVWRSLDCQWNFPFDNIFHCIKWSDDEPCEFRKFL